MLIKSLGQLKPNCSGMIIGRSSTKYQLFDADWKSKMAATAGHILTEQFGFNGPSDFREEVF
jgi:hypothetical protein